VTPRLDPGVPVLSDVCFALPDAEIKVMNLPAMSRITKIPLERLQDLSISSPVFAPGVDILSTIPGGRGWVGPRSS
jgi:hypothetical protein